MEMNKDMIIEMVTPYLKNSTITYQKFDELFYMLNHKEQYMVTDLLFDRGIGLIDDNEEESLENFDNTFEEHLFDSKDEEVSFKKNLSLFQDKYECAESDSSKRNGLSNEMLCVMLQRGDKEALQTLCIQNDKLVYSYAKKSLHLFKTDLDLEDLKQYGMIGLIKAASRYDIKENTKFSTYAVWWIKQSIWREIMNNGNIIRLPIHFFEKVLSVKKKFDSLEVEELTLEEKISIICEKTSMSKQKVQECLRCFDSYLNVASLNSFVSYDNSTELIEFICSQNQSVQDIMNAKYLTDQINMALSTLTKREEKILRMRFGIDDGRNMTLEEIGSIFNLTRERIRQIEAKAIRKLKHPSRSKKLKEFMEEE